MRPNIPPAAAARFRDLAPGAPVIRRRFRGASVSLYDWSCAGHEPSRPEEEWADGYEVVVARRGAFQWEIAGEQVPADAGTATFFHPAEPYRVRHPVAGGDAGSVFQVGRTGLAALLEEHDPAAADRARPRFPASHIALDGRAYLLHRLAMRAALDPGAAPLEVEERALAFLRAAVAGGFQRRGQESRARAGRNRLAGEYAARVAEVIAARFREPLTLGEVARAVGVSPFHLSRLVRAVSGVPIYRMILRRRLREALELVLDTRQGISRIALAVGFTSHSHLTDAFRREFGVPPCALRRTGRLTGQRAP